MEKDNSKYEGKIFIYSVCLMLVDKDPPDRVGGAIFVYEVKPFIKLKEIFGSLPTDV